MSAIILKEKKETIMKYLIDPMDLSVEEIDELIDIANDIIKDRTRYQDVCRHKILATLFFEPSTRTRLSFESAMLSLGGKQYKRF